MPNTARADSQFDKSVQFSKLRQKTIRSQLDKYMQPRQYTDDKHSKILYPTNSILVGIHSTKSNKMLEVGPHRSKTFDITKVPIEMQK